MRTYILTPREREILQAYLTQNLKLDGFSVLVIRLQRAEKQLKKDIELINAALKKLREEG